MGDTTQEEAEWRAEFERFGEEQVQSTLDRGQFQEPKAQFARRWLGDKALARTAREQKILFWARVGGVAGIAGIVVAVLIAVWPITPSPPLSRPEIQNSGMTLICKFKLGCEIASAVLAFAAAGSWFYASWIARGSFLNTPIAKFDQIQRDQARYNAIAAFCAALAALLQIWTIGFAPVCRAFS